MFPRLARSVQFAGMMLFTGFSLLIVVISASAEALIVKRSDSKEEKRLEMDEGEKGDILVSLASAGDVVSGYRVYLLRDGEPRPVGQALSDENGLVAYRNIAPGRYTVFLRKTKKQEIDSSTKLGDVLLRKAEPDAH